MIIKLYSIKGDGKTLYELDHRQAELTLGFLQKQYPELDIVFSEKIINITPNDIEMLLNEGEPDFREDSGTNRSDAMQLTLYWIIDRNSSETAVYFVDKDRLTQSLIQKRRKQPEKTYIAYELETAIFPDMVLKLLEKKFAHCLLPNYTLARSVDIKEAI